MKKYNSMFGNTTPVGDASLRFNNRPRYGGDVNSSVLSRYPHQNQIPYQQYNTNERYPTSSNQYDKGSRLFYGQNVPKGPSPQHKHPMKINQQSPPPRSHNRESTSSSFSPTAPNTLKPPPPIPSSIAQSPSAARVAQNNQQQPIHVAQNFSNSSNYYGYGYSQFFPSCGTEIMSSTTTANFGLPDTMSPYLWQTIISTPPPKLPLQTQQQQLPPPPLPQKKPPEPPPLPTSEKTAVLQPPPPLQNPAANVSPSTRTNHMQSKTSQLNTASKTIVKMKAKRKAMSARYKLSKSWSELDAALALKAEEANARKLQKDIILIVRFPDPEISREIVKCYSPDIESVHFQLNFAPRYCLVHLKPGTNVEKTIETLSKIPFGTGFLSVEIKQIPHKVHSTNLNEIDPYTLYVGNLPTTIACKTLKDHFPGAARIDIGFAQRMKYTRYAFIRFQTVQQAIEAYKRMLDAEIGGRSLTIRFRRLTSASDGNKDGDVDNIDETHDDILSQSTTASEDNSTTLNPITEPSGSLEQNLAKNTENYVNNQSNETCRDGSGGFVENIESNPLDSCADQVPISHTVETESTTAANRNGILLNIKSDPDVDPDDIVVGNEEITTRFDNCEDNVKQEKELPTDFEFFAPASSQNNANAGNKDKTPAPDTVSIHSTTDETDTMSTLSASSLGEFLQSCQRSRVESKDIDDIIGPPITKKTRQDNDGFIKPEPLSELNTTMHDNLHVLLNNRIKTEVVENNENASVETSNSPNNYETTDESRNTPETVYKKGTSFRQRKSNACNLTQASSSNNIDDMVPSNALFLRDDNQNSVATDNNVCDDDNDADEFFETRTKIYTQTQSETTKNIKTEPFCERIILKQNKSITKSSNKRAIVDSKATRSQIQSTNSSTRIVSTDGNDLVPEQNILSSRLVTQTESEQQSFDIKLESENEDLFSTPQANFISDTTSNINEDSDLSDLWNTNLLNQNASSDVSHKKIQKTSEPLRSVAPMDSTEDNDIILVSGNLSQQTKNSNSKMPSVKSNIVSYNQNDLLKFTPKSTSPTINLESSKLLAHYHHDNLDKLFAQLDSDSDSDL